MIIIIMIILTHHIGKYINSRGWTWNITTNIDYENGVINKINTNYFTVREVFEYLKN